MEKIEKKCSCPVCKERMEEEKQAEEIGLAFLIALMPLMTITVFSSLGWL